MHDVRVALHVGVTVYLHGTVIADAPQVVAAQIYEHQMLGALFGVGQQFVFQRRVFRVVRAARPGAGDGQHLGGVVLGAHEHLR